MWYNWCLCYTWSSYIQVAYYGTEKTPEALLVSPIHNSGLWKRLEPVFCFLSFSNTMGVYMLIYLCVLYIMLVHFFQWISLCFDHEQNIWFLLKKTCSFLFPLCKAWSDVDKGLNYILEMSNLSLYSDHKTQGMDQPWDKGSWINCWPYVPHVIDGADCWGSPWCESRKV